jgi:hypothetical protein
MFGLSHHQHFFLFSQAVDMRKGFDGLSGIVQPGTGHSGWAEMPVLGMSTYF